MIIADRVQLLLAQSEEQGGALDVEESRRVVEADLLSLGVHPTVAREWGGEAARRGAISRRRAERRRRRSRGPVVDTGPRRVRGRRPYRGHTFTLRPTRGWRAERVA